MFIISKFHDYYDSAMSLGVDKSVVYQRMTSFERFPDRIEYPELHKVLSKISGQMMICEQPIPISMRSMVLLICGESIPIIQIEEGVKKLNFYSDRPLVQHIGIEKLPISQYYFWRYSNELEKGMRLFFEDRSFATLTQLHHQYRCPVILCNGNSGASENITLNPFLKDLDYQKHKDPYTVFQAIQMYLSGVLGSSGTEPLPVSDEIIAANHGHDGEFSFKNMPGKKRGRKRD